MAGYKKVLIAVDGSEESARIVDKGLAIAADSNAQVDVVMVFEPLLGSYSFELNMADFEKVQQDHQARVAEKMTAELAVRFPSVKADHIHFLRGKPATEIKALAEKLGVDLVVIGTHGQNPVRAMLGSTANAVLHGTPCDILTVRV
ncbi:MAG: universal stress protein [Pseudomonadota bacterium]|nr:universal stress protein [Pseudomonadota bacterium]